MTPPTGAATNVVVIGVGNALLGDDAAGTLVADAVRTRLADGGVRIVVESGEPARLVDAWTGADFAVVVDAMMSGNAPGAVLRTVGAHGLHRWRAAGTHGAGVAEACELGRVLERLPRRLVVFGIEARCVEPGAALDPHVARSIDVVADRVVTEVREALETVVHVEGDH